MRLYICPSVYLSQLKGWLVMIPMGLSSKWDSFLSITTFPLCVHFLCVSAILYHAHTSCTRSRIRNVTRRGNVFPMVQGYNYSRSDSLRKAISCVYVYLVRTLAIWVRGVLLTYNPPTCIPQLHTSNSYTPCSINNYETCPKLIIEWGKGGVHVNNWETCLKLMIIEWGRGCM